jgi:hypothetical protein
MFEDFPVFSLVRISADEKGQKLLGQLSSTMHDKHKWIDDNWVGFLADGSRFVYGRWLKERDEWCFRPDALTDGFAEGREYIAIDGYWGERIELMFLPFTWNSAVFVSSGPNSHDHCFYCWATISEEENAEHMKSNTGEPACVDCFGRIVVPKSLDFICYPD